MIYLGIKVILIKKNIPLKSIKRKLNYQFVSPRWAGQRSAIRSASDSSARDPRFGTRSGHILLFRLPLISEGQLSVTSESCTWY